MASRINISGLPCSFTNAQLRRIFAPFGTVEFVQVLKDAYGRVQAAKVDQLGATHQT